MNRKDTIVISILVNAGLLLVLFISAITSRDQMLQPSMEVASTILENNPEGMRYPLYDSTAAEEKIQKTELAYEPLPEQKKEDKEEKIIHKLPEILPAKTTEQTKQKEKYKEIIVQKGDSLEKIAKKYHMQVATLKEINHLQNSMLKEGQGLLVVIDPDNKINQKTQTEMSKEKKACPQAEYYTVKCGDNPWTIAMKHHLKVSELLRLNNLDNQKAKKLKPGDRIRIR